VKREAKFATEADLCAAFIAWVKASAGKWTYGVQTPAWTPYAETANWDILLVAADGTQIGIQAKQRFNLKVLSQTLPATWEAWRDYGPDYRAILVPERDSDAECLCRALGLVMFAPSSRDYRFLQDGPTWDFSPSLSMEHHNGGWHYWSPRERCKLPEFVPDVVAGASGPVQLTTWKVKALRLIARLELRGHVTREDFRLLGMDPRLWLGPRGWLLSDPARPGLYTRGAALNIDAQHPQVYAEVLEETRGLLALEIA
jgi:hypothetical protein